MVAESERHPEKEEREAAEQRRKNEAAENATPMMVGQRNRSEGEEGQLHRTERERGIRAEKIYGNHEASIEEERVIPRRRGRTAEKENRWS